MALSNEFINVVQSNDVVQTRVMIMQSLVQDLTLRDFEERLSYAEKNLTDLYDTHDDEQFSDDITAWDKALLNSQIAKSLNNFSKERIAFCKKIVRIVLADKAKQADKQEFINEHSTEGASAAQVGVGVTVAGAVATVYGLVSSHPAVAAAGVAIAAVGGVMIIKNKK